MESQVFGIRSGKLKHEIIREGDFKAKEESHFIDLLKGAGYRLFFGMDVPMREMIEKLLILQDRDRRIVRIQEELGRIAPERQALQSKAATAQSGLEHSKLKLKQIESDRKKLELDAEGKKQQIERYSVQQFQTKKNEEYRALTHEIELCKMAITESEDQQIELMEEAEAAQKEFALATRESSETSKLVDGQMKELAAREQNLSSELADLKGHREQLTAGLDHSVLGRYEMLLAHKGENVVVGIQHGVCGGCHMRFPVQLLVACQAEKELVACPNCNRILYYSRDMDLAAAD
jgi:hypothetical protein